MQTKHWLIGLTLVALLALTACADSVRHAGSPTVPVTRESPPRDWGRDTETIVRAALEFCDAVGDMVIQIGAASRCVLGFLTCLILPLACLGAWALSNLGRILGMMALQDNVRSLFHD